jgi:UDP-N-acetylmuramoyl-L-alanyl-D-glutamate--2,6-diaminopimelate ligase
MGHRYALELPLVGDFQAVNALTALGLVIAENPDDTALQMRAVYALEKLQSVRGRLEFAATHASGAGIYVDYAHTPDGLESMLQALRPHALNKLHVVFGCGGDRDRGKRPMMGEIAARLADHVIVTDDNPRTEDASRVRADIMAGCPTATEIAGRRKAIQIAVQSLAKGDVLVIAGKGHEQGQIVGTEVLPFDDVTEAILASKESAA